MSSDISHVDLLKLARALQSVTLGRDLDAVHTELCSLRNALVRHIRDEEGLARQLVPAVAAAVRRGQQELLRDVDAILAHAEGVAAECRCVSEASHLTKAIARQAILENHLTIIADPRS